MNLSTLNVGELLTLHAGAAAELRNRGVTRTANNVCADLAETLASGAFGWKLNTNSNAGFDAWTADTPNQRIEIKARRLETIKGSREVSALRRLDSIPFDRLLGILFDRDYGVLLALDIPFSVVRDRSGWSDHTRSAKFYLRDDLRCEPGVVDVTTRLREQNAKLFASFA